MLFKSEGSAGAERILDMFEGLLIPEMNSKLTTPISDQEI